MLILTVLSVLALPISPAAADRADCLTAADRARADAIRDSLRRRVPPGRRRMQLQLQWPLAPSAEFSDFHYFLLSAQVDHDLGPGVLDYACGARSYDGHNGTDIAIYPFKWNMMAAGLVTVVAAAPGTIVLRHDGEFDENCDSQDVPANSVILEHADGSTTMYWHLKKGSVTPKQVGETVAAGELLGTVGSSGHSKGPHLHFEVHDPQNLVIDPFHTPGGCNAKNAVSWWAAQLPYEDPRVQKIMFSDAPVEESLVCGELAITHERASFCPGDEVLLYRFHTGVDTAVPVVATVALRDADDQPVFAPFEQMLPSSRSVRRLTTYALPAKAAPGTWTLSLTQGGVEYTRSFKVELAGCSPLPCDSPTDCPGGQVCIDSQCAPGCTVDSDCGTDATCSLDSHTCEPTQEASTGSSTDTGGDASTSDPSTSSVSSTSSGSPTSDSSSSGDSPSSSDSSSGAAADASTSSGASTGPAGPGTTADVPTDGGPVPADSSSTGEPGPGPTASDGCSCAGEREPGGASWLATLIAAIGLRRRRGRRSPSSGQSCGGRSPPQVGERTDNPRARRMAGRHTPS